MAGVSEVVAQAMRYAGCPNRRSLGFKRSVPPGPPPPPMARSKQAQLAEANARKCNMLVVLLAQQMFTRPRAISACCCCWSSTKFKLTHSAPATACEDLGMLPTAFVGSFWTMVCCASASCVNLVTQPWSSPCNISTVRSVRHDKGAAAARKLPGSCLVGDPKWNTPVRT